MRDVIYKLSEHSKFKAILLKNSNLYLSNIYYNSVDKLTDYVVNGKGSSFVHVLSVSDIKKLKIHPQSKSLKIELNANKNFSLDFYRKNETEIFGNYLGEMLKLNIRKETDKKLNNGFYGNLLGAIIALGLGIYFYFQNPVDILQTRGKRTGLFRLFYGFVFENFGTAGFLILGGIIAIIFGYLAYHSFTKPSVIIIYQ